MILRCLPALLLLAVLRPAYADNPYGLMLWPDHGRSLSIVAAEAVALGVAWFRPPAQFVDRIAADPRCTDCRDLQRLPLSLVVTLRNGGRDSLPRRPSGPPQDIAAYKRAVGTLLDTWHPAILVVENEENEPASYTDGLSTMVWDSGGKTAEAYGRELAAACEVAHARGVACANGGLSSEAAAAVAWFAQFDQSQAAACAFAKLAFYTERDPNAGTALCAYRTAAEVPATTRAAMLRNSEALIAVYRSAPIDFVNFHWYGRDAVALAKTVDALHAATGKPVMSNEMGLHPWDADPSNIRPLLRAALAMRMKTAIWFSVDTATAISLFDTDSRLRPIGQEFAHQVSGLK